MNEVVSRRYSKLLKEDKPFPELIVIDGGKGQLSSAVETDVNLPFVTADANGPKHLDVDISRAKFEQLTSDLLDRCASPCEQAMKDARLTQNHKDLLLYFASMILDPDGHARWADKVRAEQDR